MSDLINRADVIEAVCGVVIDEFDVSPTRGYEVAEKALSELPSAERNCFTCGMENGGMVFDPEDVPNEAFEATEKIVALSDVCKWIKANWQLNPKQWVELASLPSADAVQGEWIDIDNYYRMATCSRCHKVTMFEKWGEYTKPYDFCPNCGARMKGGDEHETD